MRELKESFCLSQVPIVDLFTGRVAAGTSHSPSSPTLASLHEVLPSWPREPPAHSFPPSLHLLQHSQQQLSLLPSRCPLEPAALWWGDNGLVLCGDFLLWARPLSRAGEGDKGTRSLPARTRQLPVLRFLPVTQHLEICSLVSLSSRRRQASI